jgi:hypothetical protein
LTTEIVSKKVFEKAGVKISFFKMARFPPSGNALIEKKKKKGKRREVNTQRGTGKTF